MARISPCTSQSPRYTPAEGPHTPEKMVSHVGGPHFHKGFLGKWGPRSLFSQDYGDVTPALGCIYLLSYEKYEKNELTIYVLCIQHTCVYVNCESTHACSQSAMGIHEGIGRSLVKMRKFCVGLLGKYDHIIIIININIRQWAVTVPGDLVKKCLCNSIFNNLACRISATFRTCNR